jgi:hypothetical protein
MIRGTSLETLKITVNNEPIDISTKPLTRFSRVYSIKMVDDIKEDSPMYSHKCFWTNVVNKRDSQQFLHEHSRRHSVL